MNNNKSLQISKSIKENKWLSIVYKNRNQELTSYWIAIKDINIKSRSFSVDAFNQSKMTKTQDGLITTHISFENILEAEVLDNTTYNQPEHLVDKIEKNLVELSWLNYDNYSDNFLDYIKECMVYESIPYQDVVTMVSELDVDVLVNHPQKMYELSYTQMGELTRSIIGISKKIKKNKEVQIRLALNKCSISSKKGLFVIAYHELLFDPSNQALVLDPKIYFNTRFSIDSSSNSNYNLYEYLDIETESFFELFLKNEEQAKNLLRKTLIYKQESIDDRPYFMELKKNNVQSVYREINALKHAYKNKQLHIPLKAFFGNMTLRLKAGRKKHTNLVVVNDNLNVDQFRVLNNALKQPVTYVQGPPGTGKTQCIVNLIAAAYFNDQTVLVTSNNNKPINDIGRKLFINGESIRFPLPFLRLGNREVLKESLEEVKKMYENSRNIEVKKYWLKSSEKRRGEHMSELNNAIEQYEERLELQEQLDALEAMRKEIKLEYRASIIIEQQIEEIKSKLNRMTIVTDKDVQDLVTKLDEKLTNWLYYSAILRIQQINKIEHSKFKDIIYISDEDKRIKEFNEFLSDDENVYMLKKIFPVILTTNQSVHKIGTANQHFDISIIDEASQCTVGYSLFSIMRGKRLLLVGDLNQLRPVVTIPDQLNTQLLNKYEIDESLSYSKNSIFSIMQKRDTISKFVFLRFHYRCDPKIINFSNKKYYKDELIIRSKVKPTESLKLIDVDGDKLQRSNERNTSVLECYAIIDDIKKNPTKNIGIITPYRNQAEVLKNILKKEKIEGIDIGTVHTFQGDEKDRIYLSCAITPDTTEASFDWMKNNQELINVAATRAKSELIVVADKKQIKSRTIDKNDIFELVSYTEEKGKYFKLTETKANEFINGHSYKQYNTNREKEFFDTINQVLSLNAEYKLESQVKVSAVLDNFTKPELLYYGSMSVFDLVIYEKRGRDDYPVLAIELDGDEHKNDPKVIGRDKKKEQICEDNHIKLIRITNDYSRRYMHIKEVLLNIMRNS